MKTFFKKIAVGGLGLMLLVASFGFLASKVNANPNTHLNLMVADSNSTNYRVEAEDADFPISNALRFYKSNMFINNIDWSTLENVYQLWMYLGPQSVNGGSSSYTHTPYYSVNDLPLVKSDNRAWAVYKCTGGAFNCATDAGSGNWYNSPKWQLVDSCGANSYDCSGAWLGETNSSVYYILAPQLGQ